MEKESDEDAPEMQIETETTNKKVRARPYLTEEHEHAHVELQQSGDAERASLRAAQRVKQQLSAQRALPLLGPHVDLLLAVSKCTVLSILALLALLYLCGPPAERKY